MTLADFDAFDAFRQAETFRPCLISCYELPAKEMPRDFPSWGREVGGGRGGGGGGEGEGVQS